jgi:hypothetical protein
LAGFSERCVWVAKAFQHGRRNDTALFGQENLPSIVQVAVCPSELDKAKSWTTASVSIGKIVNVLRHLSAVKLEPISILDRLVTFIQGDV